MKSPQYELWRFPNYGATNLALINNHLGVPDVALFVIEYAG